MHVLLPIYSETLSITYGAFPVRSIAISVSFARPTAKLIQINTIARRATMVRFRHAVASRITNLTVLVAIASLPIVSPWGYCNDRDPSCANWAKDGQCDDQIRGEVVIQKCPHSCSICPHTCRDEEEACVAWADNGQCKENIRYMLKHCSASCGACKTRCYDKEAACSSWAREGQCDANQDLLAVCPVSCGVCTEMCLDKHNDCPQYVNRQATDRAHKVG